MKKSVRGRGGRKLQLEPAASQAGFELLDMIECPLRSESKEPVVGFAVALKKPLD